MRILGSAISLSSIATTSLSHVSRWVDGRIWNIENVGMTVEPKILNSKQTQVMEWIRNGCPEGVYDSGYEHRISARVLERRGLVKISGRGDTWEVALTRAGREWRDKFQEMKRSSPEVTRQTPENHSDTAAAVERDSVQEEKQPAVVSEESKLLRQVIDEDSVLLPEDPVVVKRYERIVRRSLQSPLRPMGKRLEMQHTGKWGTGPQKIVFVEYFDDRVDVNPVPVPERVRKYHPSIKALLSNKEWSYVSDEHLPRAARILQAIADEAERRGLKIVSAEHALQNAPQHRRRKLRSAPLRIETTDGIYALEIREVAASGAKKMPTRAWNEKKTLPAWKEQSGWEFISTGMLELIVDGPGVRYNGDRYKDAKTISLEENLPKVLASFEIYRLKEEWRQQERAHVEAARLKAQMKAREIATVKYRDIKRWEYFVRRSDQWREMCRHREFLSKVNDVMTESSVLEKDSVVAELEYLESKINENDPLLHPTLMIPVISDPTEEDLKPFLPKSANSIFNGLF